MEMFMKLILACLLANVCNGSPTSEPESWTSYKEQYNKNYGSVEEESSRREIVFAKMREISEFNSNQNRSYEMGLNHLSDLKRGEYLELCKSSSSNQKKQTSSTSSKADGQYLQKLLSDNSPLPDSVDWSKDIRVVSQVKDQGACSSGWAFATIGLLEGQERFNSTAGVIQLSEQNLIDCAKEQHGCSGGSVSGAIEYIVSSGGIAKADKYPYKSGKGEDKFECEYTRQSAFVTTMYIRRFDQLPVGDEEALKRVVARYGPVAVSIDASLESFQNYKSGVYYDDRCSQSPNHSVLVVGYGVDEAHNSYWLIKNSWSEAWGESGYMRLARLRNNQCGIANAATISIAYN